MKYQNLLYGKNKKNITNSSSAELATRVVKVNLSNEVFCVKPSGIDSVVSAMMFFASI